MFEESTESFTARWRAHATDARIFARVENSPLLELQAGGVIFHALERTGPYIPETGMNSVIVHAMTEEFEAAGAAAPGIEVTGISRGRLSGTVTHIGEGLAVIDAGLPVVVGCFGGLPEDLAEGDPVGCTVLPPLQVFVLERTPAATHDHEV